MTALLATAGAGLYGCADFLGGLASRKDSPLTVALISQLIGLIVLVPILWLASAQPTGSDLLWGAVAGFFGGLGVAALYTGLKVGPMSIVAPITGALAATLPVIYDFAQGTALNLYQILAIPLAMAAIVLVSLAPHPDAKNEAFSRSILLAVLAGLGFAGFFIGLSFTDPASGLWPLAGARAASVPTLAIVTALGRKGFMVSKAAMPATTGAGVLDMGANAAALVALQLGPLAIAAVLVSLYPAVTVLLAQVFLKERLSLLQKVGIATALLAVVLASVP